MTNLKITSTKSLANEPALRMALEAMDDEADINSAIWAVLTYVRCNVSDGHIMQSLCSDIEDHLTSYGLAHANLQTFVDEIDVEALREAVEVDYGNLSACLKYAKGKNMSLPAFLNKAAAHTLKGVE